MAHRNTPSRQTTSELSLNFSTTYALTIGLVDATLRLGYDKGDVVSRWITMTANWNRRILRVKF